jgi:hypothetical protein
LASALQEFSMLSNIGFAQNEKEIENMVDKVVRKHSALIEAKAYNIEEKKPMDMLRSGLRALDTRRQYPDI